MRNAIDEHRVFLNEFRENFHATGSIVPSSHRLAWELTRQVQGEHPPRRILEVGAGTGAVTRALVQALGNDDRLDIVEINTKFVAALEHRFEHDVGFRFARSRTTIHHQPIQEFAGDAVYDAIISGLPFANFEASLVREILQAFGRLAKPGGTCSFFEYAFLRRARRWVVGAQERQRLAGVGSALDEVFSAYRFDCELVWLNIPPAWVHHLRFA